MTVITPLKKAVIARKMDIVSLTQNTANRCSLIWILTSTGAANATNQVSMLAIRLYVLRNLVRSREYISLSSRYTNCLHLTLIHTYSFLYVLLSSSERTFITVNRLNNSWKQC